MTATNVNPEVKAEAATEELTGIDLEAKTLLADATIVSDKQFIRLMGSVFTHEKTVGGKWASVIKHCKGGLLIGMQKEYKDLTKEEKEELKKGKDIILKSLLEMGKTPSSAQSIRSNIIKLSKPENAEALAKMEAGELTVRAAREYGRTAQANPSRKSNETKYAEGIELAVRYGRTLGYDTARIYSDIGVKFAEFEARKANETADAEKAAKDKAEMQEAIKATEAQLANK